MMRKSLFLLTGALLLSGCQSHDFPAYQTSRETLFHLQQLHVPAVSVGPFTGGPRTLAASTSWDSAFACRLKLDEGTAGPETYQEFVRQALVDELTAAGLYSDEPASTTISGTIEHVGFDPELSPFDKRWTLRVTLISSNGRQLRVENRVEFDGAALVGPSICRRAFEAFGPAVQGLIEKAVTSPDFAALLT